MATVASLLSTAIARLEAASVSSTPALDARLLLCHAMGISLEKLLIAWSEPVVATSEAQFESYLEQRLKNRPIAYILGSREFFGRSFVVNENVLIPRPDTETLVEAALEWYGRHPFPTPCIADICTGSGAIGITLALEIPTSSVILTDISPGALEVAAENVRRLMATNTALRLGDLLEPVALERFNIVVSNPPYLTPQWYRELEAQVLQEPELALVSGTDGLDAIRRLIDGCHAIIEPGGALFLECDWRQCDTVAGLMNQAGYEDTEVYKDLAGLPRVVRGIADV